MLKKSVVTCLCFMIFVLSLSQQGNCAEQNHILFCRTFNDKWEPIDPSETFETNVVSWIAQGEKSFETPRIIVSLYKKIGAEERLLERKPMDVRPAWDTTGVRNMALPEEGTLPSTNLTELRSAVECSPSRQCPFLALRFQRRLWGRLLPKSSTSICLRNNISMEEL